MAISTLLSYTIIPQASFQCLNAVSKNLFAETAKQRDHFPLFSSQLLHIQQHDNNSKSNNEQTRRRPAEHTR
eukprot:scaffold4003_cov165-Amphora_coffeaeformis.AAC.5